MPLLIIPNPFIDVQKIKNNVSRKKQKYQKIQKNIKIRDIYWISNEKNMFLKYCGIMKYLCFCLAVLYVQRLLSLMIPKDVLYNFV